MSAPVNKKRLIIILSAVIALFIVLPLLLWGDHLKAFGLPKLAETSAAERPDESRTLVYEGTVYHQYIPYEHDGLDTMWGADPADMKKVGYIWYAGYLGVYKGPFLVYSSRNNSEQAPIFLYNEGSRFCISPWYVREDADFPDVTEAHFDSIRLTEVFESDLTKNVKPGKKRIDIDPMCYADMFSFDEDVQVALPAGDNALFTIRLYSQEYAGLYIEWNVELCDGRFWCRTKDGNFPVSDELCGVLRDQLGLAVD